MLLVAVLFLILVGGYLHERMTDVTTAKDWASDQEVRWCPAAATMRC
jgi:hypothetical protein